MPAARNTYIDALKGYAILMVVVGHALQRAEVFGLLSWKGLSPYLPYSGYVTMPLFFAVSGYLSFGRVHAPVRAWLLGKARMLLVPLVAWTLVYYFTVHDGLILTDMPLAQYVKSQVVATSLWFFLVLFYCYALLAIGSKLGDWSLPVIGLVLALGLDRWLHPLDWYWGWFAAGYFFSKYQDSLLRWKYPAWAAAVAVYAYGALAPVTSVALLPKTVFALASIGVSTGAVFALRRLAVSRGLEYLGVRSMTVYVGQFLFVQLVFVHSWVNAAITATLAIAGSLVLERLLAMNPWTNVVFLGARGRARTGALAGGAAA